ncbi:hypothetical protein [Microbulbifer sp. A4B17]|uniref:hypothetical protein n=1 Tax=Microbulbifer sp. A4B17 TaxID=359370 RepID=UPI001300BBC1|nr:hypothetical protein [Microbulbifer sp. A4B17]
MKINSGFSELRFMGLTSKGAITFRLTNIDIEANKIIMKRYDNSSTIENLNINTNATIIGNSAYGLANVNTTIRHYEKPKLTISRLLANTVEFLFNPINRTLKLDVVAVEIAEVLSCSINYVLRRQ